MAYNDESKDILAKYGLYEYTEDEKQERAKKATQISQDAAVNTVLGVGSSLAGLAMGGSSGQKTARLTFDDWRDRQNTTMYRQRAEEAVAALNLPEDYKPRGSEYDDESRRIMAKYGLAGYTKDELMDIVTWQQRSGAYQDAAKRASEQLKKTGWSDWQADRNYSGSVERQLRELEREMSRVGENSVTWQEMADYRDYLQRLQQGYAARNDYFGMFEDETDYDAFREAQEGLRDYKDAGQAYNAYYSKTRLQMENAKQEWEARQKEAKEARLLASDESDRSESGVWIQASEETMARREAEAQRAEAAAQQAAAAYAYAQRRNAYAKNARYQDLPEREDWRSGVNAGRDAYERLLAQVQNERAARAQEVRWGNTEVAGLDDDTLAGEDWYTYRLPESGFSREEKETWYYLYQRSPEEAYQYALELNTQHRLQERYASMQTYQDWAHDNPILGGLSGTASQVGTSPMAFWDWLGDVVQYGNTGVIMPRTELSPRDYANALAGGTAMRLNEIYTVPEEIPILGGKGLGDAYQLANSMAESLAWAGLSKGIMAAGGSEALSAAVTNLGFFGSAAAQTTQEAIASGATSEQALALGFFAGTAEAVGETLSIENLIHLKSAGTTRQLVRNILIQGGVEASEEAVTTMINTFADALVMGDKSELQQAILNYEAQGMSPAEAERRAKLDWLEGVAYDALGGFVSGAGSGAIHSGINSIQSRRSIYSGDQQAMLELAKRQSEDSKAYQFALQLEEQGYMSEHDAQKLQSMIPGAEESLRSRTAAQDRESAEFFLEEAGMERTQIPAASRAIANRLNGNELSREERREQNTIFKNETVERVYQELLQEKQVQAAQRRYEGALKRAEKKSGTKKPNGDGRSFRVSSSMGTAEKESAVTIKGQEGKASIEALTRGEDGELLARVKNEAGEENTVPVSEIDFGESGLGELVQELKEQEDAPAMFAGYTSETSIGDLINGWNVAKAYGRNSSRSSAESILHDGLLKGVDENVIRVAFNYGRRLQEQEREKQRQQKALEEAENGGRSKTAPTETPSVTDASTADTSHEGEDKSEKSGAQRASSTTEGRKGGVSYEGGTVDGVKLKAVNRKTLSGKQKAQIRVMEMLAEKTGIQFVLFESETGRNGRYQGANGMYADGVIYIDVNAGRHGQSIGQVAMVRTAAHELTHYIQDFAPERYEELQQFMIDHLIEWKGKDLGELAAQKMQRDHTGELTMEGALDEVVADGCEMMLRRTKIMQTMAQEKPGLFQTVKNWMQKWIASVREAFRGISEVHEEARAVAELETERLEKLVELWDRGLIEATENAKKSPAREGGEVKYSLVGVREDGIEVYETSAETKALSWKERKQQFMRHLKNEYQGRTARFKRNGHTYYAKFEEVDQQKTVYGDKESDGKGYGAKINAGADGNYFDLLDNMAWFDGEQERGKAGKAHKNVVYWNYLIKTVQIDGKVFDMLANVRHKKTGAYVYNLELHERKNVEAASPPSFSDGKASSGVPTASDYSILPFNEKSNTKFQERDALPDDRALLMAAEAKGANAEVLTAYQKKVKSLEMLERKLQRQQKALEEAENGGRSKTAPTETTSVTDASDGDISPKEGGKSTGTGKSAQGSQQAKAIAAYRAAIQKTEASIRRAENKLNEMERSPQLQRETEKALAAWREQNPQEAAKALRAMREEAESQKKLIELLRQEARLTTPENRRMMPSDINRMARAIIKQYGSKASVDSISEKLQKLGDFMVANMEGGDVSYYKRVAEQARKIAQEIVNESYEAIDDNKEIREGIRSYLREHTMKISDDVRGDIPDFERWRKSHMGTLRLGKEGMDIDQAYQDLRAAYGEGFFPDLMARSDMLEQMLNTLESLEPSYQQMFNEVESWQASEAIGNEIIDRLLSGEVRERESMADRAFRQRMRQLEEKYARKDKARQKALENAEDQMKWERARRDEAEERRREERALRRQLVQEKVHELRERSIERDKMYKKRISIDKKVTALSKIMLENSGKRHVPDAWKEAIGGFLSSIDTLTEHSGEKSRAFHLERVENLQKMVAQQQARNEGKDSKDSKDKGPKTFFLINPLIEEMLEPFVKEARDSDTGTITVERLELEQMRELEEILVTLRKAVDTADSMLADDKKAALSDEAGEAVRYMEALGGTNWLENRRWKRRLKKFIQFDQLTPVYFFKLMGPSGERLFKSFVNGQSQEAFNAKAIIEFAKGTYTAKEVKAWEKETHEFELVKRESDLSGRESLSKAAAEGGPEAVKKAEAKNKSKVTISTAQIMELYCLVRREQALGHVTGGGVWIGDIETKGGTKRQIERYFVTAEDITAICSALTKRQKEVADELQKYMNTQGSKWGNEVSMKLFGIERFTEKNYYPIQTDPQSRPAKNPEADNTDLFHLLNMSFTKNTVKNADNGVVLNSIFDTFATHMSDMARYNAMCLPLVDAMKWFNYLDETDGGFTSVRKSMGKAYGAEAERYFLKLMQDINGFQAGRGDYIGAKFVSNAKVASVGANLRVAFLQPTSYVRAAAVLDPKYMLEGENPLKIKQGIREAMQYSGTANWKDMGFFDLNVNANVRDLIKHADGVIDKIREGSMWLAEKGDKLTWGKLWNATKAEVKAKTGLSGEELLRATADRFDDVIYQTQVMDSVLTRSQMMRQKDGLHGMATSFMAEPTLSYNLLLSSVMNWSNAKRKGTGIRAAWGMVGRAFAVYAASQIWSSVWESLFSALRDDDDYEDFADKFLQAWWGWGGELWQDLAPYNKLPYLRDIVSIVQGFTNKRMDTEWVDYCVTAVKAVVKDLFIPDENGNIKGLTWGTAYKCMRALSMTTGLPVSNATRDVVALWNGIVVQNIPDWKLKTFKLGREVKPEASIKQAYQAGAITEEDAVRYLMRDAEFESEDKAKQKVYEWGLDKGQKKYDRMLGAIREGNSAAAQAEWQTLRAKGYSEDTLQSAVRSAVKEWYQNTKGNSTRMNKKDAIEALVQYGGMRRREAESTVQEWTSYVSSPEKLQYDEIREAYVEGEISEERAVEMRTLYGGKSQQEAEKEVNKWRCERETGLAYDEIKDAYIDGEISEERAVELRMEYGGQTKYAAEKDVREWRYAKDTGGDYDKVKQAFVSGEISEEAAIAARRDYGGQTKVDAEREVLQWACEKETGIDYNDIQSLYLSDDLTEKRAVELRVKYGSKTEAEAMAEVEHWRCYKETGIRYDDIRKAYVGKEISPQQTREMLTEYGGYSEDAVEGMLLKYDFAGDNNELWDISEKAASNYYIYLSGSGIEKETWYQTWKALNKIESDKDEKGKTIKDSLLNKRAAYIDSLNLTDAQKDLIFLTQYDEKNLKKTPWHK